MLEQLGIVDLRGDLPPPRKVASATGKPQGKCTETSYGVLHYNGPEAPASAGGSKESILKWLRNVILPNHVARIGADGIQYHFWISADGTIYQLRDLDALLWHCGNYHINARSLAVHVPVGGKQRPTDAQWGSATRLFDAWMTDYHFPRSSVKGHRECGASSCPGDVLMGMLRSWRNATLQGKSYILGRGTWLLRREPYRKPSNIAVRLHAGDVVLVVGDAQGERVNGNAVWLKTQNGLYIHSSAIGK